jgi:predicted GNAT superfamily acetyltransferase
MERETVRGALRDSSEADFAALLRLNLESEHFLSPLTQPRLRALHTQAWYRRVVCLGGVVQGFLLALREGADYDSPNYQWFAAHYTEFLYIDRIVIGAAARGQHFGVLLYEDLIARARENGFRRIVCEFDTDPPNEVSRRFHEHFGFHEVGSQRVGGGKKAVSLQELLL